MKSFVKHMVNALQSQTQTHKMHNKFNFNNTKMRNEKQKTKNEKQIIDHVNFLHLTHYQEFKIRKMIHHNNNTEIVFF